MKRIQIGNDFRVSWTLTQLGEAFSLDGKIYEIEVSSPYGVILVSDVVAEDNILSFSIPASQQVYLGNYDIMLKITNEDGQTWRLKQCDAFVLVPCDCGEIVEVVQFASGIVYPANGLDAYQLAVSSGEYTGDYAGYQRWLARYAEITANEAVNIANEAKENSSTALSTARQASEVANEAKTVVATKQDALTLTVKDNGNIVIGNLQGQAKEFMPATPSGDPLHMAYVAAGAVWDEVTQTWSANGRSGLSNSDVRSLYNKSDMDELLFRKLWNKACLYSGDNNNYMGRYNPNTGFYELNGVWDLTYEEALASYALSTETNYTSFNVGIMIESARLRTTIPSKGYGLFFGITQNYTIADLSTTYYSSDYHNKVAEGFGNNLQISYAVGLRVIRDVINCISSSIKHSYPTIKETPVKHIKLDSIYTNYVYMYNNCPYLSYFTFEYAIKNVAKKGITLYVDNDTYAYILGTKDPTLLSKDALLLTDRTGYLIPYDKNSKVMHRNTFWREELDVKGVNGEYIYPSFAEYLANNPQDFATAEDWQALATLAEGKGVTITTL